MPSVVSEASPCHRCADTGWILESIDGRKQARACNCRTAAIRRQKLEAAGIPERYRGDTIDNFNDPTAALVRAKDAARNFVDLYPAVEKGILFVGPSGRGKTHLACAILAELIQSKNVSGLYADFYKERKTIDARPDIDKLIDPSFLP